MQLPAVAPSLGEVLVQPLGQFVTQLNNAGYVCIFDGGDGLAGQVVGGDVHGTGALPGRGALAVKLDVTQLVADESNFDIVATVRRRDGVCLGHAEIALLSSLLDSALTLAQLRRANLVGEIDTHALAEQISQLTSALDTNRGIGIAMGILMASRGITAEDAFDLLRVGSEHTGRGLRDLADQVCLTGALPSSSLADPS
ncbi:MAG TPA: ANTAR domain-containing protein [Dermatophilaceae bacterium]|nr:ANTAR domain-containing protein [Dermatophilaceae bacterium]